MAATYGSVMGYAWLTFSRRTNGPGYPSVIPFGYTQDLLLLNGSLSYHQNAEEQWIFGGFPKLGYPKKDGL